MSENLNQLKKKPWRTQISSGLKEKIEGILLDSILHSKKVIRWPYSQTINELVDLFDSEIAQAVRAERERILRNISFLRQWLNEDRITDAKKMVTNQQIEDCLAIASMRSFVRNELSQEK